MKPGIYKNISNDDYHNLQFLSCSGIKWFLRSPAHYMANLKKKKEPTPAMQFGSAFHTNTLEPHKVYDEIACFNGYKSGNKWKRFKKSAEDKTILSDSEMEDLIGMEESLMQHEIASRLLSMAGLIEHSFFWDDPVTGVRCMCRPDKAIPEIKTLIDLKSCEDASPIGFAKACANFHYDIQAPFYLAGANAVSDIKYKEFIFIAVEKKPPYAVMVYRCPQLFLDNGRAKIRPLITLYADCLEKDHWPSYDEGSVQDINLPSWALVA